MTGSQLKKLGEYYAKAIHDRYGDDFDVLFGRLTKESRLVLWTAIAYSELLRKRSALLLATAKRTKISVQTREAFLEAN